MVCPRISHHAHIVALDHPTELTRRLATGSSACTSRLPLFLLSMALILAGRVNVSRLLTLVGHLARAGKLLSMPAFCLAPPEAPAQAYNRTTRVIMATLRHLRHTCAASPSHEVSICSWCEWTYLPPSTSSASLSPTSLTCTASKC